jgi:Peptidase M15
MYFNLPNVCPKIYSGLNLCAALALGLGLAAITAPAANAENEPFFKFNDAPVTAERMRQGRSDLGADLSDSKPESLSGGTNISWNADAGCLNSELRAVLAEVAANYGAITVNSTCRSASHNAAVGGAGHSYHLSGDAVDFRVHGNVAAVANFLNGRVGGFKNSGGGLFHIDTGPRRPMN